jgi:signal peptidase II
MAVVVCVFTLALVCDRATKCLALSGLVPSEPFTRSVPPAIPSLGLYQNYGISFSLLENHPLVSLFAALIAIALLGFLSLKNKTLRSMPGMIFLWAGATGNLLDRVIYGCVIDWIYVGGYINFADVWLLIGSLMISVKCIKIFLSDK